MPKSGIATWEDLIGNTPLLQLHNLFDDADFNLFAKLEMFNLGGSMKDRAALNMIKSALDKKIIKPGSTVIESSSGNMGVGLAQACLRYGLKFVCVVDSRTNMTNIQVMKAYGAQIEMITETKPSQSLLEARLQRVQELLKSIPGSFWCNQYANEDNSGAHWKTMEEIDKALEGKIDYLFCTTGTCGTIRGCSEYIKHRSLNTTIVAVDAVGSVIFGQNPSPRLVPGHGAAVRPALFRDDISDHVMHVTDTDCVIGCRKMLAKESVLVGGSSGALVSAVEKMLHEIPAGSNVVMILADRGERYMNTIYNDEWTKNNGLTKGDEHEN